MQSRRIPFNLPSLVGNEMPYMTEVLNSGHFSGDGKFSKLCHQLLGELLGTPKALLTTSCTHALEMAAILLDIKPGDEVIFPSFTFVSTANAFVLRGARPIFVDIRPDTLNIDEKLLRNAITSKTKAIVPVHYAGVGCDMESIMSIATEHKIAVVEDNAHGLFGKYKGKFLGTFGTFATQSFHETKNFQCGEGGALLINDEKLVERAEIIREKGTNRTKFFNGQVDKYSWVDIGSSYLPSDILAALLLGQLEMRDAIQAKREQIWHRYYDELNDWSANAGAVLPTVPADCDQTYHMFYMLMPTFTARQSLIRHLKDEGITAVYHYLPLHMSDVGKTFGGKAGDCPITESVSDRLIRLPMYYKLSDEEQSYIIHSVCQFSSAKADQEQFSALSRKTCSINALANRPL